MITLVLFAIELGNNRILGPNVVFQNIIKNLVISQDIEYVLVVNENYQCTENHTKHMEIFQINPKNYFNFFVTLRNIVEKLSRRKKRRIKFFYPKPMFFPLNIDQYAFLYDLPIEKIYMGKTLDDLKREFFFKKLLWKNLKRIFTISYSSFQDISHVLNLKNLDWIYLGVDTEIFRPISPQDNVEKLFFIFKKRGIDFIENYFFAPIGKIWYRKNVINLLTAFRKFYSSIDEKIYLVISAVNLDSNDEYVRKVLSNRDKRILFLKELDQEEVVSLYNGSIAVILPSLYEGFGLPVLEALACGKQILFSNIKVFNEIYPNNRYTFNPLEPEDIKNCLLKFYKEKDLIKNNRILDKDTISRFSWTKTVNDLLDKIKE
ncbi:MAG: glycosyltransferase [bacterium]|nr:glycosyltransferase [bacterium]